MRVKFMNSNNKSKRFIFFSLIITVILFALPALLSGCGDKEEEEVAVARFITVDTSKTKTVFALGDEFNYKGLIVSALFSKGDAYFNNYWEETRLIDQSDFRVDEFNYNPDKIGQYVIYVTYNWEDRSLCQSYYLVEVRNA